MQHSTLISCSFERNVAHADSYTSRDLTKIIALSKENASIPELNVNFPGAHESVCTNLKVYAFRQKVYPCWHSGRKSGKNLPSDIGAIIDIVDIKTLHVLLCPYMKLIKVNRDDLQQKQRANSYGKYLQGKASSNRTEKHQHAIDSGSRSLAGFRRASMVS